MRLAEKEDRKREAWVAPPLVERDSAGPLGSVVIVVTTCAALAALQTAFWLVVPVILAIVLYYVLRPAHLLLVRSGLREGAAAGVAVASSSVAVVALAVELISRLRAFTVENGGAVERFRQGGSRFLDQLMVAGDSFLADFVSAGARHDLRQQIPAFFASLGQIVEPSLASMAKWVPALILIPFFTFFLLKDGRQLKALLARPVPNAFFESSLVLIDRVDEAATAYFRGLLQLTILDAATLSIGLTIIGLPYALPFGVASAVLMWIPYLGSIVAAACGCVIAATEFPNQPGILYGTLALFLAVRWLDDLVFMPMTIGRNLHIHPVVAVFTILVAGWTAGIPGMMLALPVYGMMKVVYETSTVIFLDARLRARLRQEQSLRRRQAAIGLMH